MPSLTLTLPLPFGERKEIGGEEVFVLNL